ncbi:MAG: class I SAM-dependent methyltransferase [Candidatus Omnitrophota bacterium]
MGNSRRIFKYNYSLLPNSYIGEIEKNAGYGEDVEENIKLAIEKTGLSIGYPAWNLLYYSLLCSLPRKDEQEAVVVETGTNRGFSTIILAQALKDSGIQGYVHTVDIEKDLIAKAEENIEKAGLGLKEYVKFKVQDSVAFLEELVKTKDHINFAFLDANHEYSKVKEEFSIIHSKILACKGKVYFDNTSEGGVAETLRFIKDNYDGSMVEFRNCSWNPPGNVIWQPCAQKEIK